MYYFRIDWKYDAERQCDNDAIDCNLEKSHIDSWLEMLKQMLIMRDKGGG